MPTDDLIEHGPSARWSPRVPRRLVSVGIVVAAVIVTLVLVRDRGAGRTAPVARHGASAAAPAGSAMVTRMSFELLGRRLRLHLVARGRDGSAVGTLAASGRLVAGRPGQHYAISGGDCTTGRDFATPVVAGTAGPGGVAELRGRALRLTVSDRYYLVVKPWPYRVPRSQRNAVRGRWFAGQATAFVDHRQPCIGE